MHILFDLDGTLTDSRPGIVRCYQHALRVVGRALPPEPELARHVGPPLPDVFGILLGTSDPTVIAAAIDAYREQFERAGMFENSLFPDVADVLERLSRTGHRLYIVTAKPAVYARKIAAHFSIDRFFEAVHGPELGERQYNKASLIGALTKERTIDPAQAVMIGDRAEDILGARANRLRAMAAAWGYGSRSELESASPDLIVESMVDVWQRCRLRDGPRPRARARPHRPGDPESDDKDTRLRAASRRDPSG